MTESNIRQYVVIPAGETPESMVGKEVETVELPKVFRNTPNWARWYYVNKLHGDPDVTCTPFEEFAGLEPPETHDLTAMDVVADPPEVE